MLSSTIRGLACTKTCGILPKRCPTMKTLARFSQETSTAEEFPSEEDIIERKRNKSKLNRQHYDLLHGKPPQVTEDEEQMTSMRQLRRRYAKFGQASGINPALLWPSKQELERIQEWERVAYPDSVQQMIETSKRLKKEEAEATAKRQAALLEKTAKLQGWIREVHDRREKAEKIAQEAREKKEQIIEEVRQIFGYRIDPRDEKFKEALAQKELEEKKAKKEAKKLKNQQRLLERIKQESIELQKSTEMAASNEPTGKQGTPVVEGHIIPPEGFKDSSAS